MNLQDLIKEKAVTHIRAEYGATLSSVEFQPTRKDFEGDLTLVIFPMLRHIKGNPEQIGKQLGTFLEKELDEISGFNVIKGFLNLLVSDA